MRTLLLILMTGAAALALAQEDARTRGQRTSFAVM
jgi:hypothetical protein